MGVRQVRCSNEFEIRRRSRCLACKAVFLNAKLRELQGAKREIAATVVAANFQPAEVVSILRQAGHCRHKLRQERHGKRSARR